MAIGTMWANGQYQFSQTCACGPHHQNESCHDELVVLYHFTVVSTGCLLLFFVVVFFVFVYAERTIKQGVVARLFRGVR